MNIRGNRCRFGIKMGDFLRERHKCVDFPFVDSHFLLQFLKTTRKCMCAQLFFARSAEINYCLFSYPPGNAGRDDRHDLPFTEGGVAWGETCTWGPTSMMKGNGGKHGEAGQSPGRTHLLPNSHEKESLSLPRNLASLLRGTCQFGCGPWHLSR